MKNKKPILILAIETSCDETSAAVIGVEKDKPIILSNIVSSQIDLHAKTGGIVPEVASRAHMEAMIPVIQDSLAAANVKLDGITHVAVTAGPGLIGSLLVGFNYAKSIAYAKDLPIVPINHIEGHIYSTFSDDNNFKFPILSMTVSGGHTALTLMADHGKYKTIGQTRDDAAGEAFDKVAQLLGLGFPGGPAISKLASKYRDSKKIASIEFPRPMINDNNFDFSYSGLKTAALSEVNKRGELTKDDKEEIAYAFEDAAVDLLVTKTIKAVKEFKPKAVLLAGGVAANKHLREQLAKNIESNKLDLDLKIAPMNLCGDNAAMIGLAAYYHIIRDDVKNWNEIKVDSNFTL